MNLINCYGFSVDLQTMRVYLTEGKVASLSEGVPQGPDGVTKGSTKGEVVQKLAKVVTNSDNNLLYVDIAGEPYKGVIKHWEFLPHTEDGHLLMDSKGEIKSNYKGLSFTNNGGVALTPKSRPDPIKGRPLTGGEFYEDDVYEYALFYSTATTGYEALRTEDGRYTTFEVLLIGAGGGGKGQTVTFGKGGDGGGGQLFVGELPPAAPGSVFVTVPAKCLLRCPLFQG